MTFDDACDAAIAIFNDLPGTEASEAAIVVAAIVSARRGVPLEHAAGQFVEVYPEDVTNDESAPTTNAPRGSA